ncbi:MAG: type I phosphomannose isomerase catalytic subunit [Eubacteriales bacterium]
MNKYPLKLSAVTKSSIWGGDRLKTEFGIRSDLTCVAEAWTLSVREKEMSVILNGPYRGMTLGKYISLTNGDCVSAGFGQKKFPLLIKLIDAADKLSVQVHPDDKYASEVEHDVGKTEMWYIVDAKEGAELIYGMSDEISPEEFRNAVNSGDIGSVLRHIPVHKGETYFIPSGMLHAIGAGILIAEIQQNSDLTYRVYDYDRRDKNGKTRELHVKKALDVTRKFTDSEINAVRFARGNGDTPDVLANSEFFRVVLHNINGEAHLNVTDDSFAFLLCIEGNGKISYDGTDYTIKKGEGYFLPAGLGFPVLHGNMTLISAGL